MTRKDREGIQCRGCCGGMVEGREGGQDRNILFIRIPSIPSTQTILHLATLPTPTITMLTRIRDWPALIVAIRYIGEEIGACLGLPA